VSREGAADYLTFAVIRDEIRRKSCPTDFPRQGIAYIKITGFEDDTAGAWKRT